MNIAMVMDPVGKMVGGSFFSTLRFAELLSQRGNKVIFIAAKYPNTPSVDYYKRIKIYRFISLKVPRSEGQIYISFPTFGKIRKIFLDEKINLLHVMVPTPSAFPAIRAARELHIPFVAHSHTQPENLTLHLPKILRNSALDKFFYRYLLWVYKKADIVICPTEFSERLIKRYDKDLKTVVISNGVDLRKFKKVNPESFIKKHGLNPKHRRILFVGRLHPEKCVHTLIEAMPILLKRFADVHLDIVAGSGNLGGQLKALAKELNVEKHVTFFGRVSDRDLLMAYNACNIFCLPSVAELEGMVVLEAMACGKPLLIANSKNSASRYFVKGNGLLFKPGSPRDLADKAVKILSNKRLEREMARRSYEMIKEYDIRNCVSKLEKVYAGVASLRKS